MLGDECGNDKQIGLRHLRRHLSNRSDLGMGTAMLDTVLDPANPFDSPSKEDSATLVCVLHLRRGSAAELLCLFQRSDLRENCG